MDVITYPCWNCEGLMLFVFFSELFLCEDDVEKLHDFEEESIEDYFRAKEQQLQSSTDERIRLTAER